MNSIVLFYLLFPCFSPIFCSTSQNSKLKKGFIKITENKIIARKKSIDLLLGSELLDAVKTVATSKTAKNKELVGSVEDWIQEWRELFPAGIKSGGYPVRSPKSGCAAKMKVFIKKNKEVTKEIIFTAIRSSISQI